VFVAVGVLTVALGLAVALVVHSLDRPWVKRRIQAAVHSAAGVDIDYASVHVGMRCVVVDGLTIESPVAVREVAPTLLRVGYIEGCWLPRVRKGPGPTLDRLVVSQVALTVVVDEHGTTSFDLLAGEGPKPPPSPPTPLSHRGALLLSAPPLRRATVDDLTVALVRTEGGRPVERTEARGLAAALTAEPVRDGWRLSGGLGSAGAPLDVTVTRERRGEPAGTAHAALWLAVSATPSGAEATLDTEVLHQTLVEGVSSVPRLHVEADVAFAPDTRTTTVAVHDTRAGDGAVTAEAKIDLPDDGEPRVRHAQGDVDVAPLLHWIPAGLVPLTVEGAHVRCAIDDLSVGPTPHLDPGGSASLDAEISKLHVGSDGPPLDVDRAVLSLRALPAESGAIAMQGKIRATQVRRGGASGAALEDLAFEADGRQTSDGSMTGNASLRFGRAAIEGPQPFLARNGSVHLGLDALRVDTAAPLATRGTVDLEVDIASFAAGASSSRTEIDGLALHARTALAGRAPYSAQADASAKQVRLFMNGRPVAAVPAKVNLKVGDAYVDLARPVASRATIQAGVDAGDVTVALDATKGVDTLDYGMHAAATSLRSVRPFVPPALADQVRWDAIAVTVKSSGRVEHLLGGWPAIDQATTIGAEHVAFGTTTARSVTLSIRSRGDAVRHHADVDLRDVALAVQGGAQADDHTALSLTLDRDRRSLQVGLSTDGRMNAKIDASASFDGSRRAVDYSLDAHVGHLAAAAPILAKVPGLDGLDFSQLDAAFSSRGVLLGVVAGMSRDGHASLESAPSRTARVEGTADLRIAHLQWARGDDGVIAPELAWRGALHAREAEQVLDSHLELPAVHLDLGPHDVDVTAFRDDTTIGLKGDLADPSAEVKEHTTMTGVQQDFAPEYPVGDVAFDVDAGRDPNGVIHVVDLGLDNGAGGTTLHLSGNLQLGAGRHTLSLTTKLTQDLGRLTRAPDRFTGHGTLGFEGTVLSPDLAQLRIRASVTAHDLDVALPHSGVEVHKADGVVPVTVSLAMSKDGIELKHDATRSPYSTLRFTDQHPLLSRSGYLSVGSIKSPYVTIAPLVGNLAIEQRFVSLRQFEMGVRGGTITGQMGVDWEGPKSTLELHVRATGVQSSHGEPFDGNIAVAIAAGDRTIEGRAEVLRIGERHLLDLLDLQDPTHADPAMNRIRTALLFGYPERLRISFDHGFASARLELGGLARLVSISEIRGIPMGPIIDRLLQPPPDAQEGEP
jgi:translocation and assembly module TamB